MVGQCREGVLKAVLKWRFVLGMFLGAVLVWYFTSLVGIGCAWRPGRYEGRVEGVATRREGRVVEFEGDVRDLNVAWNRLCYGSKPPASIRIALFVKKWPTGGTPGGLERHAMTLHRVLADRGHEVHVFTVRQAGATTANADEEAEEARAHPNLHLYFVEANPDGGFNHSRAFEAFVAANTTIAFDIVHSESVALPHWRAKDFANLAASWHGIQFEIVHSDIVQDLIRPPGEDRSQGLLDTMSGRLVRVADEVRFFPHYRNHVATSDFVGNVLRTIYELPLRNVHIILNGVNEQDFRPNPAAGAAFRTKYALFPRPLSASKP